LEVPSLERDETRERLDDLLELSLFGKDEYCCGIEDVNEFAESR